MKTLKDLFLNQLADIYDAEQRIDKMLTKLAKSATCTDLKTALDFHSQESASQIRKLAAVFQCFDAKPKAQRCEAAVGILKEADGIIASFKRSPSINAALIAVAQKVEHYEIASYGCLHEWAQLLNNQHATDLLQEILDQEKDANNQLTKLARNSSNVEALGESCVCGEEEMNEQTQYGRHRKAA